MPNFVEQRKVISQQTFDAAVQENEQEFFMERSDAIQNARAEFEQLGVDLSNIKLDKDKLATPEEQSDEQHPVIESCMELSQITSSASNGQNTLADCLAVLKDISEQVKLDERAALIAAENGVLTSISSALEKAQTEDDLEQRSKIVQHLGFICSKHEGVRKLVNDSTKSALLSLGEKGNSITQSRTFLAASWIASRNEDARRFFHDNQLGWNSLQAIEGNMQSADTIISAFRLIKTLVANDDPNADNSKAFDNAREYMTSEEFNTHELFLKVGDTHANEESNPGVLVELALTIKSLAVNDEICKAFRDNGIANGLLKWHRTFPEEPKLAHAVLSAIRKLCHSDHLKRWVVLNESGPLRTIVEAIQKFPDNASVIHQAIGCIAVMALRHPSHAIMLAEMNGIPLITRAMKRFPEAGALQRQGCLAIRNLVVRNEDKLKDLFLEEQAELLLRTAREKHQECDDVAYAALRDLDLLQL
eukprot:gb/GECG01003337.1/.p1 GENE.gb/GECG01003337.1/~~gb/GECG01003337.1/.p1  ORF type:complete len:476 (+),score=72.96 gb/GECG01003337.1/:1-1428(+)